MVKIKYINKQNNAVQESEYKKKRKEEKEKKLKKKAFASFWQFGSYMVGPIRCQCCVSNTLNGLFYMDECSPIFLDSLILSISFLWILIRRVHCEMDSLILHDVVTKKINQNASKKICNIKLDLQHMIDFLLYDIRHIPQQANKAPIFWQILTKNSAFWMLPTSTS